MKDIFRTWLLPLLAAAVLGGVLVLSAVVAPVGLLALPVTVGAAVALAFSVSASEKISAPLCVCAAVAVLAGVLSGQVTLALILLLLFVPAGVASGLALRRREAVNDAALLATVIFTVGALLTLCAFTYELTGSLSFTDALVQVKDAWRPTLDALYDELNEAVTPEMLSASADIKNLLSLGKEGFAEEAMDLSLTALLTGAPLLLLGSVAAAYFAAKHLCGLKDEKDGVSCFDHVRLKKPTAILLLVSTVMSLPLGAIFGASSFAYLLALLLENALSVTAAFCGFSLLYHLLRTLRGRTKARARTTVILLAVASLFLDLILLVFTMLGLYDAFADIRSRIVKGGPRSK